MKIRIFLALATALALSLTAIPVRSQNKFDPFPGDIAAKYHFDLARNFFPTPEAAEIDRTALYKTGADFSQWRGKLSSSPDNLYRAFQAFDLLQARINLHASYLFLRNAMDTRDTASRDAQQKLEAEANRAMSFFSGERRLQRFEKQLDDLRRRLRIPGMSVGIVKDQKLVWAKGFGYADVENKIPATPRTLFHLASVTKTFASMLIMQLVEQGKLDLDEPVSHYSSDFKDDSVKIKHLITHTSAGTPGESFRYNGNRYGYLRAVIEKKTGKKFTEMVVKTFFEPLGMTQSVPYHKIVDESDKWTSSLGKERLDRYKENLTMFAQPYTYYGSGEIVHTTYPYPEYNGPSAGILSTVVDMAKYDAAIDRHVLIKKETQEKAWTPFIANSGKQLPYGLGWFVMDQHGHKLVWHTGSWGSGFSALLLKIPKKNVSLILLANSEALIDHQYSIGEVMVDDAVRNVFACSFLDLWGLAYDCERTSNTAMTTFIEQRRISGRTAIRVDPKILESYAGKYQFEKLENGIFTVTRDGDKLHFTGPGTKTDMFAESATTFFSKIMPWRLIFEGQPAQLNIVRGDQTFYSKRLE